MIKDKISSPLRSLFSNKSSSAPTATPEVTAPAVSQGSPGSVSFSRELSEQPGSDNRLNSLVQGLNSWGDTGNGNSSAASPAAGTNGTNGSNGTSGGGWDDVMKSGQMPMGIINQVFSTFKNAGGMATAGALHSLLSWGVAERKKTGKIRPEFQEILREAIDIAKKNRNMSEADLAKYESALFGGGSGEGADKGKGKGKGIGTKVKPKSPNLNLGAMLKEKMAH